MNIPKKLKIGGYEYDIVVSPMLKETADGSFGKHHAAQAKIYLTSEVTREMMEETFIHEIVEAINSHHDLELDHRAISTISEVFYQIIKDNNLGEK